VEDPRLSHLDDEKREEPLIERGFTLLAIAATLMILIIITVTGIYAISLVEQILHNYCL